MSHRSVIASLLVLILALAAAAAYAWSHERKWMFVAAAPGAAMLAWTLYRVLRTKPDQRLHGSAPPEDE